MWVGLLYGCFYVCVCLFYVCWVVIGVLFVWFDRYILFFLVWLVLNVFVILLVVYWVFVFCWNVVCIWGWLVMELCGLYVVIDDWVKDWWFLVLCCWVLFVVGLWEMWNFCRFVWYCCGVCWVLLFLCGGCFVVGILWIFFLFCVGIVFLYWNSVGIGCFLCWNCCWCVLLDGFCFYLWLEIWW